MINVYVMRHQLIALCYQWICNSRYILNKLLCKTLNILETWGITWDIRFNAAKCNIMRLAMAFQIFTGMTSTGYNIDKQGKSKPSFYVAT